MRLLELQRVKYEKVSDSCIIIPKHTNNMAAILIHDCKAFPNLKPPDDREHALRELHCLATRTARLVDCGCCVAETVLCNNDVILPLPLIRPGSRCARLVLPLAYLCLLDYITFITFIVTRIHFVITKIILAVEM